MRRANNVAHRDAGGGAVHSIMSGSRDVHKCGRCHHRESQPSGVIVEKNAAPVSNQSSWGGATGEINRELVKTRLDFKMELLNPMNF